MEEQTGKDRMNNKVVELLEQKQLGWISSYINTTRCKFLDLTKILWYIDGCHKTLEGRRLSVRHIISEICGYNKPEIHSHKRVPMEAMKLCTFATSLFKIGEEPWISNVRWSDIKEAITNLATNLSAVWSFELIMHVPIKSKLPITLQECLMMCASTVGTLMT